MHQNMKNDAAHTMTGAQTSRRNTSAIQHLMIYLSIIYIYIYSKPCPSTTKLVEIFVAATCMHSCSKLFLNPELVQQQHYQKRNIGMPHFSANLFLNMCTYLKFKLTWAAESPIFATSAPPSVPSTSDAPLPEL